MGPHPHTPRDPTLKLQSTPSSHPTGHHVQDTPSIPKFPTGGSLPPMGSMNLPVAHAIPISFSSNGQLSVDMPAGGQQLSINMLAGGQQLSGANQHLPRQAGLEFADEAQAEEEEASGRSAVARELGITEAELAAKGAAYEAEVRPCRHRRPFRHPRCHPRATALAATLPDAALPSLLTSSVPILLWTEGETEEGERAEARRARARANAKAPAQEEAAEAQGREDAHHWAGPAWQEAEGGGESGEGGAKVHGL